MKNLAGYLRNKIDVLSDSGRLLLVEKLAVGLYDFVVQARNTENNKLAEAFVSKIF